MSPLHIAIARTVAATAAATLVLAAIFFFFFYKYCFVRCRVKNKLNGSFRREEIVMASEEFKHKSRSVKELNNVGGNGIEVFSLRKLENGQIKTSFPKVVFNPSFTEDEDEEEEEKRVDAEGEKKKSFKSNEGSFHHEQKPSPQPPKASFALYPPMASKKPTPLSIPQQFIPKTSVSSAPPPISPPPPPPPPPPPLPTRRAPPIPPSATKTGISVSSVRTLTTAKGRATSYNNRAKISTEESSNGASLGQMKLKPLHWDKVMADVDHSTVWDEINDGSLRFDDELMETLFGYTNTNRQSSERNNLFLASNRLNSGPPTQVFLLDPRKSQNTAIVLRSLALSRKEILNALLDGNELGAETLEKLTKISPNQEEAAKILQFNGNPSKLADAEAFLYHILKAVPSAFIRFTAMLFRANYDPEILHFKESLQTLELGCKELRVRGLFLKLLEAILKAGNRMNAGTARGNAQAFNLTALKKLSDIRSNDGKTTLLHFVVEQVARSEGKQWMINHNNSNNRSTIISTRRIQIGEPNFEGLKDEEKDRECLFLGLPLLEGLSRELSNVKKAATIDYESFISNCSTLSARVAEIRKLLSRCDDDEKGWFLREMKGFLEECEEEIKVVKEEQNRVMELVKRTIEYYQAGASKEKGSHPFQLFVIVKDFLDMIDQACVEIAKKMNKKNSNSNVNGNARLSPPVSPSIMTPKKFPNFHSHFMSDMSLTSSSESEDDF